MSYYIQVISKALRVIESCTSIEHLNVAIKFANLALHELPDERYFMYNKVNAYRLVERAIGIVEGKDLFKERQEFIGEHNNAAN